MQQSTQLSTKITAWSCSPMTNPSVLATKRLFIMPGTAQTKDIERPLLPTTPFVVTYYSLLPIINPKVNLKPTVH